MQIVLISHHHYGSVQQAAPAKSARTECVSVDMSLSTWSGQLPRQMFYWIRPIASSQGSTVWTAIAGSVWPHLCKDLKFESSFCSDPSLSPLLFLFLSVRTYLMTASPPTLWSHTNIPPALATKCSARDSRHSSTPSVRGRLHALALFCDLKSKLKAGPH